MDKNEEIEILAKLAVEYFGRSCLCDSDEELSFAMKVMLTVNIEAVSSILGWEQMADMLEEIRLYVIENKDNYSCRVQRPETEH